MRREKENERRKISERVSEWWFRLPLTTKLCYECCVYVLVFHFVLRLKQHSVCFLLILFILFVQNKRGKINSCTFAYLLIYATFLWFVISFVFFLFTFIFIFYPLKIISICVLKLKTIKCKREFWMGEKFVEKHSENKIR